MLTLLNLKLAFSILTSVSVIESGAHAMVSRSSADRYAVIGEGFIHTKGCTVTANGMQAQISRDGRWLTFIDDDGETEAVCMIGEAPVLPKMIVHRIHRGVATL